MVKKLPILRRLEVALAETSSESEKDIVYGLLGSFYNRLKEDNVPVEGIYENINHKTLSTIGNSRNISTADINTGIRIAKHLKNYVSLPSIGEKAYRAKMLKAVAAETSAFKIMYQTE